MGAMNGGHRYVIAPDNNRLGVHDIGLVVSKDTDALAHLGRLVAAVLHAAHAERVHQLVPVTAVAAASRHAKLAGAPVHAHSTRAVLVGDLFPFGADFVESLVP